MRKLIAVIILVFLNFGIYSTWVEQYVSPTPPKLNCISTDMFAYFGWIGGDNGTVLYTSNAGQNWIYKNSPVFSNNNINIVSKVQTGVALCSATSTSTTFIYQTTDFGNTWNIVYQQPSGRIRDIKMSDEHTGFAYGDPVGGRWTLLKTTNAGLTFDSAGMYLQQQGNETGFYNDMFVPYQINYVYFGTNNSRIYISNNGGQSWIYVTLSFQNIKTVSIGDFSRMNGFAGGNGAAKTTNYGITWQPITLPGSGDCNAFTNDGYQFTQMAAFYCKTSQIYLSTDGGQNFSLNYNSPNGGNYTHILVTSYDIDIFFRHGWAVRDNGGISRFDTTIYSSVKKIGSRAPVGFILFQNYPNPFNPTTRIQYDITKNSHVVLKVFDADGHQIAQLVNEQETPGTYEAEFDGSVYASGVYFYRITISDTETSSGYYSETKKMVLIK